MQHQQKIAPPLFSRVSDRSMSFWIADTDDGFQLGDTVLLREFNPEPLNPTDSSAPKGFTGQEVEFGVGYVHIQGSRVIFSLIPLKAKKAR